jgi:hypothetical protein
MEFTWAHKIVNRFVEENDGYEVRYALVTPILNQDEVISLPGTQECADIHEYSKKFNSYIKCEVLSGRLYTQHEQINLFLSGMDSSFQPAISRVQQMLEHNTGDFPLPDAISMKHLPESIE